MLFACTMKSYLCLRNSQKQSGDVRSFGEVFISCFCAFESQVNQRKDSACPIFRNYSAHSLLIMQQWFIPSKLKPDNLHSIYLPSLSWVFVAQPFCFQPLSSTLPPPSSVPFQVIAIFLFLPACSVPQICLSSYFQCSPLSTSTTPASSEQSRPPLAS
jgi:hypothetical protein